MALSNVLVAVDGSKGSQGALNVAIDLATLNPSVQFDIVNVIPIPRLNSEEQAAFEPVLEMMTEDAKGLLSDAVTYMSSNTGEDVDVDIEAITLKGTDAATEILKLIESSSYDLIIIGSRGISGRKERIGSVSYKLLHESPIPVLIAK